MLVRTTAGAAASRLRSTPRLFGLVLTLTVIATAAATATLVKAVTQDRARPFSALLHQQLQTWVRARGHAAFEPDDSTLRALSVMPGRWLRSRRGTGLPRLVIDVKFQHAHKLFAKRSEALQAGWLMQGPDDFVPASIRIEDRTLPVELRLKGDFTDHLDGKKWSFRVNVKGSNHVHGMRRFSLQHPKVRAYQSENLFFETMRHVGVMAPRYEYVEVTFNGENIGIMALEEHFGKELLEANGRRESVVLRFDETLVWEARDGWKAGFAGNFDDYRNADIDAFQASQALETPRLAKDYAVAEGLLRSFVNGTVTAAEVFDAELMGRYLAVAELWGAWHATLWTNQRFYYNPITTRLEPVPYDASLQHQSNRYEIMAIKEPLVARMLADPHVMRAYKTTLHELARSTIAGDLIAVWKRAETPILDLLRREFFCLDAYPYDYLHDRAKYLAGLDENDLLRRPVSPGVYPLLVHAFVTQDGAERYCELANAVPHDVEVVSLGWGRETKGKREKLPFVPVQPLALPLTLPARSDANYDKPVRVDFIPPLHAGAMLEVVSKVRNHGATTTTRAKANHPALQMGPIPRSTIEAQLAAHPFLQADGDSGLQARPGMWTVRGSVVVPSGATLRIPSGTTLRFATGEGLFSHGTLRFEGSARAPVVLDAAMERWQGVVTLSAPGVCHWAHVVVRNTSGIDRQGWELTGGVTFYRSTVHIEQCRFEKSHGEDALNIVNSKFELIDSDFEETASDAFDADFCSGTVQGGVFRNVGSAGGGDALDVSGSIVSVAGTRFANIGDKAISVGEKSSLTAHDIEVDGANTGAACKDGSVLQLADAEIRAAKVAGLMAYVKKAEHGHGRIEATNVRIFGPSPAALAQHGSQVRIDDQQIASQNVDVDKLYETVMHKGARP